MVTKVLHMYLRSRYLPREEVKNDFPSFNGFLNRALRQMIRYLQ